MDIEGRIFDEFGQQVRVLFNLECAEYRLLLVLCIGGIIVLACLMPFLLRATCSSDNSYCTCDSGALSGEDRVHDRWQNQGWHNFEWRSIEWQSKVHESCQIRRERGIAVLVTGAAGFIGFHVCLALKERGDGVVGLDNLSNSIDFSLKRERKEILERNSVFVIEGDINDDILLRELFKLIPFTHVLHLAAQTSIRNSSENPGAYVRNNIGGLVTLLDACRKANPPPAFIWTSSSSVYGLNSIVPSLECDRSDQPASLYAASKKAGEGLVYVYNHSHGISTTTLRLGTVYGPWGRSDMAYWIFARDILRGKEITIYEGPNQAELVRDWTFVDDIVQGCLSAVDTAEKSTGRLSGRANHARFRTFNLGCRSPVTVLSLVNILEEHLQVKAKIRVVQMPSYAGAPSMYSDIGLARLQLGYNPTTSPYAGLKKFVDWYLGYHGLSK